MDIHLRLQDGHQPCSRNLQAHLKLLVDDPADAGGVGLLDDAAHLGAEDMALHRLLEQLRQAGHGLHQLHALRLGLQALIHLEEGDDLLDLPQVVGAVSALDHPVHGVLKEDGAQDMLAGEGGGGDDPASHLVDEGEHLLVAVIGALLHAVGPEGLGGAAAALVQGGDKAFSMLDGVQLLCIHAVSLHNFVVRWYGL